MARFDPVSVADIHEQLIDNPTLVEELAVALEEFLPEGGGGGGGLSDAAAVTAAYEASPSDAAELATVLGVPITETFTVPSSWILAHSSDSALRELKAGVTGKVIMLLGGVAKLVYGTTVYTGATTDTDVVITVGVDDSDLPASIMGVIPIGFWEATADNATSFITSGYQSSKHKSKIGAGVNLNLLGAGLADGDSDVEITLTYVLV